MLKFRAVHLYGIVAFCWFAFLAAGCGLRSGAPLAGVSARDGGSDAAAVACSGTNKMSGANGVACGRRRRSGRPVPGDARVQLRDHRVV
jgi:hypothetical protein